MLISFLITLCVSTIFGFIGFFSGGGFFIWFFTSFVLQYVIFFIVNSVTKAIVQMQINRLEVERLNKIDENRVRIKCSVCKELNDVIIDIKGENEFRCIKCGSLNSVSVAISNFQKTEFLDGVITEDIVKKLKKEADATDDREKTN
jgi:hypothetical protein